MDKIQNTFIEAMIHDSYAVLANKSDESLNKSFPLVVLENWFPVYHSGYYAIVGIKKDSGVLIMSEPIISSVGKSGRVFESPRRYYEIVGKYNLQTFSMYEKAYDMNYDRYITDLLKDFSSGLPKNWMLCIDRLHAFINTVFPKLVNVHEKTINKSFDEIVGPISNYSCVPLTKVLDLKRCLHDIFREIKKKNKWPVLFKKQLSKEGYSHLFWKLNNIKMKKLKTPEEGRSSKNYKSLMLWYPERGSNGLDYYINGCYAVKDKRDLVTFRSKIVKVLTQGLHVITTNGCVRLLGPICCTSYEESPNWPYVKVLISNYLLAFSHGFPPQWEEHVTVIDIVQSMDFVGRNAVDLDDDDKENR